MKHRVGKCPVCGQRAPIGISDFVKLRAGDKHPTQQREKRVVMRWHESDGDVCAGRWMEPQLDPQLERQRNARTAKRLALVEPFRLHAAVAHDALAEGRDYPSTDVRILLRVATFEYRLYHADANVVGPVKYVARMNKANTPSNHGDIYCTFCGLLLRRQVRADSYGMSRDTWWRIAMSGDAHAAICALQHLTFGPLLPPAPPSARRLPDEFVREESHV